MMKEKKISIGVQAASLAQELTQDFEGTFARLKVMGFDSVEPYLCMIEKQGKLPANLWSFENLDRGIAAAKKYGLHIQSAHIGMVFGPFKMSVAKASAGIRRVMEKTDIRYFVISGMFTNDKEAAEWGKTMCKLSEALADTDAVIVYHNHDVELNATFSGGQIHYPLETFFSAAGPSVKLQLDIGWAAIAADECHVFDTFRDRIVSIHCKDFYPDARKPNLKRDQIKAEQFAPIGCGFVKTKEILQRAVALPGFTGSIIIDQDKCNTNRMEELRTGEQNITQYLNCFRSPMTKSNASGIQRNQLSLMTFSMLGDVFSGKMTLADTLKVAAGEGIPFVDVMMVSEKQIPIYCAAMASTGVKINCYIANIDFFAKQEKIKKQLSSHMSIAEKLNARFFMIVPYLWTRNLKTAARMDKATVQSKLIQGFRLAVTAGHKMGLRVCFENTPHPELHMSASEDCLYILSNVARLEYVYDTANMLPAGETPELHYQRMRDKICYVHLKDVVLTRGKHTPGGEYTQDGWKMNCCLWGHGVIPVDKVYTQMRRDGYTGTFAIEYAHPAGTADWEIHAAQLAAHLEYYHL